VSRLRPAETEQKLLRPRLYRESHSLINLDAYTLVHSPRCIHFGAFTSFVRVASRLKIPVPFEINESINNLKNLHMYVSLSLSVSTP
jgi:hypothetical protein